MYPFNENHEISLNSILNLIKFFLYTVFLISENKTSLNHSEKVESQLFWWDFTFQKVKQSSSSECSTVDIAISEEETVCEREKPKQLKNGKRKISSFDHYIENRLNFS